MKKVAILLAVILLASSTFAATTPKKAAPAKPAQVSQATAAQPFTISPKFSYIGWMGIGCEFSPLYNITKDINLMGEVNWDFWAWSGSAGYIYGELNAVYHAQPFEMGGQQAPLNPYVGGGLIYGFPMGTAGFGGNFTGGIGYAIFGGVTGKFDPYIWYAQLKFANAPITWNYNLGGFFGNVSASTNALGMGMEFGVRFPM